MRFPLLLACAALLASAIATAGAADVWVEGRWENCNGQYQWRAGYWQTATTTTTVVQAPPAQVWVEGRWAQGANGWVWVEGHYENAPCPPQPVVVQQPVIVQQPCPPPVVVVERPCPPPVVVSANIGYGYGYGYGRPMCTTPVYRQPAPVYCPPRRPVYCPPPVTHCPPTRSSVSVRLPAPTLAFPTVKVGSHRLPLPPIPVFKHR